MPFEVIILFTIAIINIFLSMFILRNQRNQVGVVYSVFVFFIALWSLGLAFFLLEQKLDRAIWLANSYYVAAAGITMMFLYFSFVFPKKEKTNIIIRMLVFAPTLLLIFLFINDKHFLIKNIFFINNSKEVVLNSLHYSFYGIYFVLFVFFAYCNLGKSYINTENKEEKTRLKFVIIGTLVSYLLGALFNLFFPWVGNYRYIWLGPLFTLNMVFFVGYAVVKHDLFNIKTITTELITFGLWVFIFIRTLLSETTQERVVNGSLFIIMIIFGVFLVRSVRKEVDQRERTESLAKDLQVANQKLKELDDLKTDFISIASHQLRTPLTAIKGYSSMILEGTYGDSPLQIKGVVDKIFQSSQRLIFIVNDLLDVSRIEQGRFTITLEEVKLVNVIRDVTEELKANAEKKDIALSFEVSVDDADIKVSADFSKIRQVFTNLIDNSLKYTNEGYVKILLKVQNEKVLVSIKDSGIGISSSTIPNLFQKFTRAKGVSKLHTDGSGLGLYVAREIVKAHHGEVWAESEGEGKGSQFYVSLPLKNSKAEEAERFTENI